MVIVKDFRLTIELVPKPCWYSNLRGNMTRANWDKLRRSIYQDIRPQCRGMYIELVKEEAMIEEKGIDTDGE